MKILVTGVAGFIGAEVALCLLARGDEVVGLDCVNDYYSMDLKWARLARLGLTKGRIKKGELVQGSPGFRFFYQNLEEESYLQKLFAQEEFDGVVHLAAQAGVRYSLQNPQAYIQSNIIGTFNILEACRHHPIQHLVYASSSSVYGANAKVPFSIEDPVDHPVSLYAATKKSNELMAHSYSHLYKIPTTGLRFFTVYGPWGRPDMAPLLFSKAILAGKPIQVFNQGNMRRDFTYIDDIVRGTLQVLDTPPHTNPRRQIAPDECPFYRVYNIGHGAPVDLMEFIRLLEQGLGKNAQKEMRGMQDGDVPVTWADTTALEKEIGYLAETSLETGITKLVQWIQAYRIPF
ncbi:MAG TPA: NAD-dependent epimerase [Fibrobacteraceae bacterium]|nr:NAD-dependent epimerase [Fibrobacteraceae bacterium]